MATAELECENIEEIGHDVRAIPVSQRQALHSYNADAREGRHERQAADSGNQRRHVVFMVVDSLRAFDQSEVHVDETPARG